MTYGPIAINCRIQSFLPIVNLPIEFTLLPVEKGIYCALVFVAAEKGGCCYYFRLYRFPSCASSAHDSYASLLASAHLAIFGMESLADLSS